MNSGHVLLTVGLLLLGLISVDGNHGDYTDQFAVELEGGDDVAQLVAGSYGFKLERKLRNLKDMYLFSHPEARRTKRSTVHLVDKLRNDPNVRYAEQQVVLKREKRSPINKRYIMHDKQSELHIDYAKYERARQERIKKKSEGLQSRDIYPEPMMQFNDPEYENQWYLENRGQNGGHVGNDLNVVPAWQQGFTGRDVVICVLDDGLQHDTIDLKRNYWAETSADFNSNPDERGDPSPNTANPDNSHGTRCAGEIGAEANNSFCGVGIAYDSKLSGIRILDGVVTDSLEAEALTYMPQDIDIYSASWGPPDNGMTQEGPSQLCANALQTGAEEGRGGLGSIYVWATGNGGTQNDTCSCDGYVGSIYTISIGSITESAESSYFSEVCPSTMAVVFTGGLHEVGVPDGHNYEVITTDINDGCTEGFQGTSAAAPLAAGCIALSLQANPNLTWRDVQYLIVKTARVPTEQEALWFVNGAGKHLNPHVGFGVLDCSQMVEQAQNWETVPPQQTCSSDVITPDLMIEPAIDGRQEPTCRNYTMNNPCTDDSDDRIKHLEHTVLHVQISSKRRGNIAMDLYSPMGTGSHMLEYRSKDKQSDIDFDFGGFMTVFNWGEDPVGDWVLRVCNADSTRSATLEKVQLTLYGVATNNEPGNSGKRDDVNAPPHEPTKNELTDFIQSEEKEAENVDISPADDTAVVSTSNDLQDSTIKDTALELFEQILREPLSSNKFYRRGQLQRSRQAPNFAYKRGYYSKNNQRRNEDEYADVTYDDVIEAIRNLIERR